MTKTFKSAAALTVVSSFLLSCGPESTLGTNNFLEPILITEVEGFFEEEEALEELTPAGFIPPPEDPNLSPAENLSRVAPIDNIFGNGDRIYFQPTVELDPGERRTVVGDAIFSANNTYSVNTGLYEGDFDYTRTGLFTGTIIGANELSFNVDAVINEAFTSEGMDFSQIDGNPRTNPFPTSPLQYDESGNLIGADGDVVGEDDLNDFLEVIFFNRDAPANITAETVRIRVLAAFRQVLLVRNESGTPNFTQSQRAVIDTAFSILGIADLNESPTNPVDEFVIDEITRIDLTTTSDVASRVGFESLGTYTVTTQTRDVTFEDEVRTDRNGIQIRFWTPSIADNLNAPFVSEEGIYEVLYNASLVR